MAERLPLSRRAAGTCIVLALLAAPSGRAAAQQPVRGRVVGVVFDSLSGAVLANAVVIGRGGESADTTDPEGRFELTLLSGPALLTFEHPRLSGWPLLRHATTVEVVEDSVTHASLATASPGTILERACRGSGWVVGGVVRDLLTLVPIPGARVSVRRTSAGAGSPTTVASLSDGAYHVCLGERAVVEVDAGLGSARSRGVPVDPGGSAVVVQDLFIRASEPATLSGRVVDGETGRPMEDVTLQVVGGRLRAGTRADGTFLMRGLPPGVVRLRVERIGYGSGEARVEAAGGDSLDISVELFPEAIAMSPMVVTVSGAARERRETGSRLDGLERSDIERLLPRSVDFDDLLRNANIPGLKVRDVAFMSSLGSYVPGVCVETSRRSTFSSDVCEMVEVYLNDVRIAEPEILLEALAPGDIERFRLLDPAEASIRYAATPRARNGVLLIYTRGR